MMTYYFHEEAEKEFNQAIDYYEECQPHLGVEFAEEVFQTIQRILKFPDAWQTLHQDIRRCLTKRFPFGIIYYRRGKQIVILAVMQLNREPSYWETRR